MKILLLLLIACILSANYLEKELNLARDEGLVYYLSEFHQTSPSNDIKVARGMYFQEMIVSDRAYSKIYNYINKYIQENPIYDITNFDNPKRTKPVYFIMCLEMYKSKDYHNKIKDILQKSCDSCWKQYNKTRESINPNLQR